MSASWTSYRPLASVPYALPHSVGYLGQLSALTPYSPPGSGYPGAGNTPDGTWAWGATGMRNDNPGASLDHVYVYGGIYITGSTVKVTNSIIRAGTGSELTAIQMHGGPGPVICSNSTLGWIPGFMPDPSLDIAPIYDSGLVIGGYYISYCDLSGGPQGLDPPGSGNPLNPSLVQYNWIHDLVQNNPGNVRHIDGIFSQGLSDLVIIGNYIDVPARSDVTAAVFFQDTGVDYGIQLINNYLSGGSVTYHNESGANMLVTGNTFSGLNVNGNTILDTGSGASIGLWVNNRLPDGTLVPQPT